MNYIHNSTSDVTCMVPPDSVVPATENRDIVRYLRNLSVSLLEGSRTSDLRKFSKFRDFSENRSVLFPSALATPTLPPRSVHVHRLVSSLCPSSFPSAVRLLMGQCGGIGVMQITACIQRFYLRAAISDCLLIGFIRATETLRKN
jgi:hypothetical protein